MAQSLLDKDIREPLFDYLDQIYGKNRILEEKMIGKSRADIVMVVPDEILGIEIKSDADTYARIARQVKDYDRYFDRNLLVVGSSHAGHASEHVPEYWGILSVEERDGGVDFYVLREPKENPKRKKELKLSILWRPELSALQEKYKMPVYKNKSKDFVREKILEKIPWEDLNREISETLFERDYSSIQKEINEYRVSNGRKPRRARKKWK